VGLVSASVVIQRIDVGAVGDAMTMKVTDTCLLISTFPGWTKRIPLADVERVALDVHERSVELVVQTADGRARRLRTTDQVEAETVHRQLVALVDPEEARADHPLPLGELRRRIAVLAAIPSFRADRLVRFLLTQAHLLGVSDLHIDGTHSIGRLAFRIDGLLHDIGEVPNGMADRLFAHLKIASGVASYRRDILQEGRMALDMSDKEPVEVRLSVVPAGDGEKAVARLFNRRLRETKLDALGFSASVDAGLMRLLGRRQGLILLTGPTASGKTTTIYSAIRHLMTGPRAGGHVATIEDPVECRMPGVTQARVEPARGMTFPKLLGALLRQDAEVIVVGEIRDTDTAQIAVQAAMTGQLLLSTLHAGSATDVVIRLFDLGIEPYRVAGALIGVLNQRLVRTICPQCVEDDRPDEALMRAYARWMPATVRFRRGAGCDKCFGTGYRGRTVVGELLEIGEPWRDHLRTPMSAADLRTFALESGLTPIVQDAVSKACAGITTLAEVRRALGDV
jgi:type IV pilus assembly protein PilB